MSVDTSNSDKLLIVDGEPSVVKALAEVFRKEPYVVLSTTDSNEAIAIAGREQPAVVLCSMNMPGLNGVEVLKAILNVSKNTARVLLGDDNSESLALMIESINLVHLDRYLSKPCDDAILLATIKELVDLHHQHMVDAVSARQMADRLHEFEKMNADLERCVAAQGKEIRQTHALLDKSRRELKMQYLSAVKSFSNLMESRSPLLSAHGLRVAELARLIAKEMKCNDLELQDIYIASLLHDIGKLGLDDQTIFKPVVELHGEERVALMKHPMKAQTAFQGLAEMANVSLIIRHHHERYDGQGFPDGLAENNIPLGARILAVAEDYDELQLGWLASKAFTDVQSQAFLVASSGKRYDPAVIAVLSVALEKLRAAERAHEKIMSGDVLHGGLVLSRDFVGPDGFLWLSKDQRVTLHFIDRVKEGELLTGSPLKVYTVKTG